jgi:hypothetical protein
MVAALADGTDGHDSRNTDGDSRTLNAVRNSDQNENPWLAEDCPVKRFNERFTCLPRRQHVPHLQPFVP